jgi:RimJ/RimL family protein N-acetyltransferase
LKSEPVKIIGNRLILRDWQLGDLPHFAQWLQSGHRWASLDGPYYPNPSPDKIPHIIERMRGEIETAVWDTPRLRLVIADKETNQFMGTVSRYWESEETDWLSVGIVIHDPTQWRKGLGFEALGLWCDYLFAVMGQLVRLDLRTWSGNHGMMRLAEKLGYLEEARFRDARIVKGKYYDGMGYGVLRSEWETRYPNGFAHYLHNPPLYTMQNS